MIKGARSIVPDLSRRSLPGSEEAGTVALRHRDIRRLDQFVTNNRVPRDQRAFEPEPGTRRQPLAEGAPAPPKVPVPLLLCFSFSHFGLACAHEPC
jgi:hypothetical protein